MTKKCHSESIVPYRIDDAPALITGDTVVTFAQYHRLVAGAVVWLSGKGVKTGDRVAILSDNSAEYVVFLMALIHSGAVACPLSTRYPAQSLPGMLAGIGCRAVLYSREKARPLPGLKAVELPGPAQLKSRGAVMPGPDIDRDATILFTSGTGALPKAVLHTYGNHYYSALGSNDNIALRPGDRWLLSLPLYHVGGLGIVFRCLIAGATVVIPQPDETIAETIARREISHLSMVPTQLSELVARVPDVDCVKRIRCVLVGGSSISASLIDDAMSCGLKVRTTYGSTEMASQVTTSGPDDPWEKLYTSGRLLPHREMTTASDGEILVRGKTLFNGYVLPSGLSRPFDDDGWFHTGDMGNLDSDGYLVVSGRIDNMFISGGENIHPEEIEALIRLAAGIDDAVVVPIDDPKFGQRPVAFVKPVAQSTIDSDALLAHLRESLPKYKIPVRIMDWPQAGSGNLKHDRKYFLSLAKELKI